MHTEGTEPGKHTSVALAVPAQVDTDAADRGAALWIWRQGWSKPAFEFRTGGHGVGGLGRFGSFIVHAAIWHIVGQAVGTIFRRFPALGTLAALLLVASLVFLAVRWAGRRRRYRSRAYPPGPYDRVGRGPRDW